MIQFSKCKIVKKNWGQEEIIRNCPEYCGKILRFNKGAKFSSHFHGKKTESFLITGLFIFNYIDTKNAKKLTREVKTGDVITIFPGQPHQLICLEENSFVFEVSTQHFESDSYRIEPGDSQKSELTDEVKAKNNQKYKKKYNKPIKLPKLPFENGKSFLDFGP